MRKEPDSREVIWVPGKAGTEAEVLEVERRGAVVAKDRAVCGNLRFETRSDQRRPAHAGIRDEESIVDLIAPGQRHIVGVKNGSISGHHERGDPRLALQNQLRAEAVV